MKFFLGLSVSTSSYTWKTLLTLLMANGEVILLTHRTTIAIAEQESSLASIPVYLIWQKLEGMVEEIARSRRRRRCDDGHRVVVRGRSRSKFHFNSNFVAGLPISSFVWAYHIAILVVSFSSIACAFSIRSTSNFQGTVSKQFNDSSLVRYRSRIAYDGSGFAGMQLQNNGRRSIQGELESVLGRRFNRQIRVVAAGRTDAGVHARGQAIHFDLTTEESRKLEELDPELNLLQRAMNKMLTEEIRIWNIQKAPPPAIELVNERQSVHSWNVMRKTVGKLYVYRFCTSPAMDPCLRHNRWQLDLGHDVHLDMEYLQKILQLYEGSHDFVCFSNAIESNQRKTGVVMSTIRTVESVELIDEGNDNYRIEVRLEGALYKMVRNLVGTAIDVAQGRVPEEFFRKLLLTPGTEGFTRDDNKCKPAPPQGLTLEWVFYDPNEDSF